jgi:WD40 repeat protein
LGDDDFHVREAATVRLMLAGEPALPALHKALASDDLEVRLRAGRIVAAIEARLYPELRLVGHTGPVSRACVSADGKRLLTSGIDKTLRLWDAYTGVCLRVFKGHTAAVWGLALSPDGKRVLSGGDDKTVRLWDATTGKELRKMTGHARDVINVAFAAKGKGLSVSSGVGSISIIRLNTIIQQSLVGLWLRA